MNPHRPHAPRFALAVLATLVLARFAAGCGGAGAAMTGAETAPASYQGVPIERAADDLTRYENEVRLALGGPDADRAYAQPGGAQQGYAQPPGQYPAPTATATSADAQRADSPPPPPAKPEVEAKAAESRAFAPAEPAAPVSTDPCAIACRALASMGRAADHICDIAGSGDERCGSAKDRLKNATERVQAACRSCD